MDLRPALRCEEKRNREVLKGARTERVFESTRGVVQKSGVKKDKGRRGGVVKGGESGDASGKFRVPTVLEATV